MRLIAFVHRNPANGGTPCAGALLSGGRVLDFGAALGDAPVDFLEWLDLDGSWLGRVKDLLTQAESGQGAAGVVPLGDVRLIAPVPRPPKVICIGLNYRDHAIESKAEIPKSPIAFSKFATSIVGPGDAIVLPRSSRKVDYEAEMAVVIGRKAKHVTAENALHHVLGYANFHDVSARDFQFADGQWQRGKSCDTFGPIGPAIVTADEIPDPHALRIRFRLNGETLQDSSTAQLIFRVPELIEFLSDSITLLPGDVIATGTPPGVGFARNPPIYMKDGDVAEVEVEGLGILTNTVKASA
jgi:2-keto-4-pentenoate hydratase/2-oxohepta-3-ene-1,7-dioic acid hydratase in catechol pathway